MKLTNARRAGLDVLAAKHPDLARESNITSPAAGYVYWQTARWLVEHELAYSPSGSTWLALTPRGVDVVNGLPHCRECGCTENSACDDGCSWVEPDLCSSCAVGVPA